MEPPSSINADQGNLAGQMSDDPLSKSLAEGIFMVVTCPEEGAGEVCYVSLSSAQTGLSYMVRSSSIIS